MRNTIRWRIRERAAGTRERADRRLAFELVALVCLKLVLLGLVWEIWFASPLAKDMQMAPDKVRQHLVQDPLAPPSSPTRSAS